MRWSMERESSWPKVLSLGVVWGKPNHSWIRAPPTPVLATLEKCGLREKPGPSMVAWQMEQAPNHSNPFMWGTVSEIHASQRKEEAEGKGTVWDKTRGTLCLECSSTPTALTGRMGEKAFLTGKKLLRGSHRGNPVPPSWGMQGQGNPGLWQECRPESGPGAPCEGEVRGWHGEPEQSRCSLALSANTGKAWDSLELCPPICTGRREGSAKPGAWLSMGRSETG